MSEDHSHDSNDHSHESDKHSHQSDYRQHEHKRPSGRALFTNWSESELPFAEKLRLTCRNQWIKIRRGQSCCGHEGEPGC